MLSPYGLDIIESCLTCSRSVEPLFCCLPAPLLQAFETIKHATSYPKGAVLFVEGQAPRGIFVVCQGAVHLFISGADGKTLIVKTTGPGDVLGLSATMSGKPYELAAKTMEPCQVNFVKRDDFLRFLKEHPEACFRVIEQLSQNFSLACHEMRFLRFAHSAEQKFVKWLVEWSSKNGEWSKRKPRIRLTITQDEIAQMIGTSRETITRAFADLKKRRIAVVEGSLLVVSNKSALKQIADT